MTGLDEDSSRNRSGRRHICSCSASKPLLANAGIGLGVPVRRWRTRPFGWRYAAASVGWLVPNAERSLVMPTRESLLAARAIVHPPNLCGRTQSGAVRPRWSAALLQHVALYITLITRKNSSRVSPTARAAIKEYTIYWEHVG
jgi:hypothetical protein